MTICPATGDGSDTPVPCATVATSSTWPVSPVAPLWLDPAALIPVTTAGTAVVMKSDICAGAMQGAVFPCAAQLVPSSAFSWLCVRTLPACAVAAWISASKHAARTP